MALRARRPAAVVFGVALAALAFGACAAAEPRGGDAAAGRKIFQSTCVACHKPDGSGGIKLTGNPTPNWKDPKYVNNPRWTDAYLRDCITNGKMKSGMVAWGKTGQIKPADIENLIAYIHTLAARKKK